MGIALVGSISGDQSPLGNALALTWPALAALGVSKSTRSIWHSPLVYWALALMVLTVLGRWFPTDGVAALVVITFVLGGSVSLILWLIFGRQGDLTPLPAMNESTRMVAMPLLVSSPQQKPWYRRTGPVALVGSVGAALVLATIFISSQNSSNPLAEAQADGALLCLNYDTFMREVAAGQHTDASMLVGILDLEKQAEGADSYIGFRIGMMRDPFAQELSDPQRIGELHREISVACEMYGVSIPRS